MKIEEYLNKHSTDSKLILGLLALALVDGWNREYDPEHADKVNKIFECYLSMRDAQIELVESLCTNKKDGKCTANYGAPCVYQCINEYPEPTFMYSCNCDRKI